MQYYEYPKKEMQIFELGEISSLLTTVQKKTHILKLVVHTTPAGIQPLK